MGLKKLKKIFIENFSEIIKNENSQMKYISNLKLNDIEINLYKPKNELIKEKNGRIKLNISYPINEELLVKLIKNKINLYENFSNTEKI